MKKKILVSIISLSAILTFVGCGANEGTVAQNTQDTQTQVTEPAKEPELTVEELDAMIKEEFNNGDSNHNRDQVKEWCNQAIEMGSGYALYVMSSEYFMDEDYQKAIELAQAAIDKNEQGGYVMMAYCYQNGLGVEKDINKTIELANSAISNDIFWGYAKLGDLYSGSIEGVERDEAIMFENYKAYCDLEKEDINYSYYEGLAACYQKGMGVEKDSQEAIKYYTIAADNGRPHCYAFAASMLLKDKQYLEAYEKYIMYTESDADFEKYIGESNFLYAGKSAYETGDYVHAREFFQKSIALGEPGADTAKSNLEYLDKKGL